MFGFIKFKSIEKMVDKILKEETTKDCTIIYKCENKSSSAEIEGEVLPIILGLIALEQQILKNDELKTLFEILKDFVGVIAEEEIKNEI